jgi:hypothetical protein
VLGACVSILDAKIGDWFSKFFLESMYHNFIEDLKMAKKFTREMKKILRRRSSATQHGFQSSPQKKNLVFKGEKCGGVGALHAHSHFLSFSFFYLSNYTIF